MMNSAIHYCSVGISVIHFFQEKFNIYINKIRALPKRDLITKVETDKQR